MCSNTGLSTAFFSLVCDDIIRAHKLGCLHVTALHVCEDILWVGTSAGVIVNIHFPQLIDASNNATNKLSSSSLQVKTLPVGHAGPVRCIISTQATTLVTADEGATMRTLVLTIGDGFDEYASNNNNSNETLGRDDAVSHLILWTLEQSRHR